MFKDIYKLHILKQIVRIFLVDNRVLQKFDLKDFIISRIKNLVFK